MANMPPFLAELEGWTVIRDWMHTDDPEKWKVQIEKVESLIKTMIGSISIQQHDPKPVAEGPSS